jgi:hypothetical protein
LSEDGYDMNTAATNAVDLGNLAGNAVLCGSTAAVGTDYSAGCDPDYVKFRLAAPETVTGRLTWSTFTDLDLWAGTSSGGAMKAETRSTSGTEEVIYSFSASPSDTSHYFYYRVSGYSGTAPASYRLELIP